MFVGVNQIKIKTFFGRSNKLEFLFKIICHIFRHEYLGMQSKYSALETRSKELITQQGGAVSGASMALAGLGSRLDQLVEQLIASYNISEQELEVSRTIFISHLIMSTSYFVIISVPIMLLKLYISLIQCTGFSFIYLYYSFYNPNPSLLLIFANQISSLLQN